MQANRTIAAAVVPRVKTVSHHADAPQHCRACSTTVPHNMKPRSQRMSRKVYIVSRLPPLHETIIVCISHCRKYTAYFLHCISTLVPPINCDTRARPARCRCRRPWHGVTTSIGSTVHARSAVAEGSIARLLPTLDRSFAPMSRCWACCRRSRTRYGWRQSSPSSP